MLYLIWAIINLGAFLFFIYICVHATRLIRNNVGLLAACVFVLGLLSLTYHSNNKVMGQSSTLIYAINPDSAVEFNSVRDVQFTLQKTLTTSIYLNVLYGKAKISKTTALLKAYAAASGLQTGTSWTCHAVVINALPGHNQFTCEVLGTEGWYLLGFNIYNRTMHFTNTFHLPK